MFASVMLMIFFSFTSTPLIANDHFVEDCEIFGNQHREIELYSKQVVSGVSFNPWEQTMVMIYINHELSDFGLRTFEHVVREIEAIADELYLKLIQDRLTGQEYLYVWSYPGENEFGVYLDRSGNILAEIKDGELVVKGEWCET